MLLYCRYQSTTRREEIGLLLKGKTLPPPSVASAALPPPSTLPLQTGMGQHVEIEVREDTSASSIKGQLARMQQDSQQPVSRTTMWRRKRKALAAADSRASTAAASTASTAASTTAASTSTASASTSPKGMSVTERRIYMCGKCGKAATSEGHTQFRGQRYCPNVEGQIPKGQWQKEKKEELELKKKEKE
eukprot:scpid103732/ scgid4296/ 